MGHSSSKLSTDPKLVAPITVSQGHIIVQLRNYKEEILENICIKVNGLTINAGVVYNEVQKKSRLIKSGQYTSSKKNRAIIATISKPVTLVSCSEAEAVISANETYRMPISLKYDGKDLPTMPISVTITLAQFNETKGSHSLNTKCVSPR